MAQGSLKRHNANIIQFGESEIDGQLREYFNDLDALTNRALRGRLPEDDFRRELERLTLPLVLSAFLLAGGSLDEPGAQNELSRQQAQIRNSIGVLTDDLYSGRFSRREVRDAEPQRPSQTADEGRQKLRNRLALWVYGMAGIYTVGQTFMPPRIVDGQLTEPRLIWRRGPTEDPCDDCLSLDGTVLTAREWRVTGIRPQSPQLACTGRRCLCGLYETEAASVGLTGVLV
jgi:hypothetical protein